MHPHCVISRFASELDCVHAESTLSGITGVPRPAASCVGVSVSPPNTWTRLLPTPVPPGSVMALISIYCGILCTAYHLTRRSATDSSASLWAIPDSTLTAPLEQMNESARHHPKHAASTLREDSLAEIAAVSAAPMAAAATSCGVGESKEDPAGAAGASGGMRRSLRQSMRVRRLIDALEHAVPPPEAGPVIAQQAAAFVCFVLDVTTALSLYSVIGQLAMLGVMHVNIRAPMIAGGFVLSFGKAWLAAGRFGWRWLSATSQVCTKKLLLNRKLITEDSLASVCKTVWALCGCRGWTCGNIM